MRMVHNNRLFFSSWNIFRIFKVSHKKFNIIYAFFTMGAKLKKKVRHFYKLQKEFVIYSETTENTFGLV